MYASQFATCTMYLLYERTTEPALIDQTTKRPPVSPVKEDGHYHPPYRRGDVSPVYEEDHSSHAGAQWGLARQCD